ncbi:uncharacterized protein J8A68_004528 [[Candida] subhashii]|uniref:F-box domain-containing protein n=1 Tax=[Candida] subhashii TaxID=561895 RepID=A0A8J5UUV7_9ASCO|nr:uncharacterized protein J8A68_004528 [[Candida] subhashii]KAG7661925.1 hypothetical protein J8A68_004528 [[Candida] subhashii]
MAELFKDWTDTPGGITINKLEAQLAINNAPKEESSLEILLDEVKQLRIQVNELLKPKNDMSKGIFILPNEILRIILSYLNQMDTIHLALTHRSFDKVCKEKLFKSLYVDEVPILINIPKKLYSPFYMKYTIIHSDRFFELLSSFHYKPELIKSILFVNDEFVSYKTLSYIIKDATNCSIRFQHITAADTKIWIIAHQKTTRSDYFMFNYGSADVNPREIPEGARLVSAHQFLDRVVNEMALSKMKRLKSITLIDPPSFVVDEPIVVDELYLTGTTDTLLRDILKWFALSKIRRLQVWCDEQTFPDTMCSLAPELQSLRALELNFESWDDWQKFTEKLKRDSNVL